jgi:hypothetical protein
VGSYDVLSLMVVDDGSILLTIDLCLIMSSFILSSPPFTLEIIRERNLRRPQFLEVLGHLHCHGTFQLSID